MPWMGIVACIALCGCKFDTSTSAASQGEIDGSVTGDALGGVEGTPDANGNVSPVDAAVSSVDADVSSVDAAVSSVDASFQSACANSCPGAGGICDADGTCKIYCNEFTNCGTVNCPQDVPCDVVCMKVNGGVPGNACDSVVCSSTMPCVVRCTNGTGSDFKACNGVSCNNNCSCQVNCVGEDSCSNLACNNPGNCDKNDSCQGSGATCNSCS